MDIGRRHIEQKKAKTLDEMIEEALKDAPKIQGYTVRQIAEGNVPLKMRKTFPREYRNLITSMAEGRAKIKAPKKRKRSDER